MDKTISLSEALEKNMLEGVYFSSDVSFCNQGLDFMLYRIPDLKASNEKYIFVVPVKYDQNNERFIDLAPVEVFKEQHLADPVFVPKRRGI